ncbi:MFS transporter [Nocardia sp. NEAU-G5]|uniref:MFS transporter n=1 Tax=Nocardia albiluteola TaxID=2842303 RepID=A0ABS6B198_9NOCA|nr:MFS transporter [Nocardia albiluteola]MBU3062999.1 MFS transporter [Nocardia albiluteola]
MATTSVEPVGDPTGRLDHATKTRIFATLVVIVVFTEVAPLQYTMISAALQKIAPSFPAEGANINWSIIVFGLVGAAASPLLGKMSDVWGKKRMFLVCGALFVAGCVMDAVVHSWALFLVGRGLQALAIATQVIAYGLIRDLMPRRYVPLGLGITATGLGVSAIVAPLVGGYLVDNYSWRAIFWFLAGFTIVVAPFVMVIVPESKLRVRERIDVVGAVLLSAGATLTLIYLDKGQDWGWGRPLTLAWLIGGLALLVLFVVIERRATHPIMDMGLLFHPRVSLVLLAALFGSFMVGVQSYAIGYMTQTPKADVVAAGVQEATLAKIGQQTGHPLPAAAVQVHLNPGYSYGNGFSLLQYAVHVALLQAIIAMVCGALGGMLARKVGPRLPLVGALTVFVGSGIAFALLPHTWVVFLIISAVFGIGFGFFYAAAPILIVEGVPQEQQGISVGMSGVMQSMGTAVGLAIITAFLNASPVKADISVGGHHVSTSVIPDVFTDRGYNLGFWAAVVAAAIALGVALIMRHGRTPATGGAAY